MAVPAAVAAVLGATRVAGAGGTGTDRGAVDGRVDGHGETSGPSVTVEPDAGVGHGEELAVRGEGFPPGVDLALALCTADAVDDGDARHCDLATARAARTDGRGRLSSTVTAKAVISTRHDAVVDCTGTEETCVVGVADVRRYDGGRYGPLAAAPLAFDAGQRPDPPRLEIVRDDLDGSPPRVSVAGTGHEPRSRLSLVVCLADRSGEPVLDVCDHAGSRPVESSADGRVEATLVVGRVGSPGGRSVDCAATPERCVVTTPLPPPPDVLASVGLR